MKTKSYRPQPAVEKKRADDFNACNPIGTRIRYSEVMADGIHPPIGTIESKTRSEAWVLGGHTAVILLDGKSGCVVLSHCETIP